MTFPLNLSPFAFNLFDAVELFNGEAAGGGEALYVEIRVGAVAGGEGIGFGSAANAVDEGMEVVRA